MDLIKLVRQLCAMAIVICGVPTFAAEITYNSQERFTRIGLGSVCGSLSEQEDAIGFEPFDSDLSREFELEDDMFTCSAFARATQSSQLTPTSIVANGSATGTSGPPVGSSAAGGQSHFEVGFSIDEAVEYMLELSVPYEPTDIGVEFGEVRFLGPSFSIDTPVGLVADSAGTGPIELTITESGVVQPGDYSLLIDIENGGAAKGFVGEFDLNFQIVPEPGIGVLLFGAMVMLGATRLSNSTVLCAHQRTLFRNLGRRASRF